MTRLATFSRDRVYMEGLGVLDADQTTAYTNFTPPADWTDNKYMRLTRHVSSEDVETQNLNLMPGFRFSWWYTGVEVTPADDKLYKDTELTKLFVR